MADQYVEIILDKPRRIRFTHNGMADLEEESLRRTGLAAGRVIGSRSNFAAVRLLLWGGLRHEDQGLTVERVGVIIQKWWLEKDKPLADLYTELMKAVEVSGFFRAAPAPADGEAEEGAEGNASAGAAAVEAPASVSEST
jgi:hypothetical protein